MEKSEGFNLLLFTPQRIVYEGKAFSVILPGEKGVFEVLAYHKSLISRLISGFILVDGRNFFIRRGVVKVGLNKVVVIAEEGVNR